MPFNPFSIKEQDGNFTLAPSASSLGVSDDDTKVSLESTCSHIATAINGNLFSPGSSYINQELYPRSEPEPCPLSPFHPPDYLPLNDVFGLNGVSFAALSESEGLPFAGGLDDGCPFDFLSIPANHADPIDIHAQIQGNKVNKSDSQPEAARAKSCTTTRSQDATVSATITPLSKAASDLAHNDFKTRTSPSTILEPSGTPTLVSSNNSTHQQDPQHEISRLNVLKSQVKQNMPAKSPGIKVLPETKELFLKLTPSIGKVTTKTLREFLVNFMKTYHRDIPLDRLSHLLFHGNFSNSEWKPTGEYSVTESKASTKTKLIAIQLCHLIVEQLQTPHPLMSGGVGSELPFSLPPTTNSHELARSFLAIKIILASVKKAEGDMSHHYTLPRYLVYKVYYIVCQNLIQRSPDIRDFSTQSLILSQSSFGKLTSLIFSHLKTKRLGSRGKSKYNFVGVTWDTTFVGKDVIRLLELDLPQIRQIFENGSQLRHSRKTPNTPNKKKCAVPGSVEGAPKSLPSLTWKKPGYSYINSSQTFPAANCAPRIWESVPGKVPQQSPWALEHMQRSIVALKLYHIELDPFIRRFNAGKFSDDNKDNLVNTFSRALGVLQKAKAPNNMYLHLYFIILVTIFPVVLGSNIEVNPTSKTHFLSEVRNCSTKVESEKQNLLGIDESSLKTFVGILKRMVNFNQLTSCSIKTQYSESILRVMTSQLEVVLAPVKNEIPERSPLETMYIRSIVVSMNSFSFKGADASDKETENIVINSIQSLAKIFKNQALMTKDEILMLSQNERLKGVQHVEEGLPYQVFKIALQIFHEFTLSHPLILSVPMVGFTSVIESFTNWVQSTCLNYFQIGDTEFAKELFKCCWVVSSMHHEYIKMLTEIVALGHNLSQDSIKK